MSSLFRFRFIYRFSMVVENFSVISSVTSSRRSTSTTRSASTSSRIRTFQPQYQQSADGNGSAVAIAENPFVGVARSFTRTIHGNVNFSTSGTGSASPLSPGGEKPPLSSSSSTPQIEFSPEEEELFELLKQVIAETNLRTTLRVAGGWVRDKLLATKEFRQRYEGAGGGLSSSQQSKGRKGTGIIGGGLIVNGSSSGKSLADPHNMKQPVDIDIALDDMLGREFADRLNEWLSTHGREIVSVGMVLKNPEKSKHLETATMKVNQFWIDFVNLRAEEYAGDSRIPDLMRIGTAEEDAFRRDLTINSLFYNINTGAVEDLTGRGVQDLRKGVVATPLPPLTTLLDDPLRVLRSVRFAARLRFSMDEALRDAAQDARVREALALKVSRERVGGEVDLMLRSYDPVGAMRLLINLKLIDTVFPISEGEISKEEARDVFYRGLVLLSTTHDHLCDCKRQPPVWCQAKRTRNAVAYGTDEQMLIDDEESRRLLWYASFLKPLRDRKEKTRSGREEPNTKSRRQGKKAHQSIVMKLMIDDLKRSVRDAEDVERIQKAAEEFTKLIIEGGAISASTILLSGIRIQYRDQADGEIFNESTMNDYITCTMTAPRGQEAQYVVDPVTEQDPMWLHAMEFRLLCSKLLLKINNRWRAALILSLSEQLALVNELEIDYAIEGDVVDQINEDLRKRIIAQYDTFAAALVQLGLIGIWNQKPLIDGDQLKEQDVLPNLPYGPMFREVMDEQIDWMTTHPGGDRDALVEQLQTVFPAFAPK